MRCAHLSRQPCVVQREDAESAKLFEEFAASFGTSEAEAPGSSAFVRGGTIQPGSRPSAGQRRISRPRERRVYIHPLSDGTYSCKYIAVVIHILGLLIICEDRLPGSTIFNTTTALKGHAPVLDWLGAHVLLDFKKSVTPACQVDIA